jgi:predicted acyl esterase
MKGNGAMKGDAGSSGARSITGRQSRREFLAAVAAGAAAAGAAAASGVRLARAATPASLAPRPWPLPHKRPIKAIENMWIGLKDGTRLAMRLWLPEDAERSPVPVVLEYLPYRKRDGVRARDQSWAESFTPYGFGFARVDIRGTGESDGVLLGEYLQQEQDDGVEIIAWLAQQSWCDGNIGMRGISWSGFNTLQIAARAPPALKAIMPQCATDNRYTDDAHYVGGALTLNNYEWGAEFKEVMVLPPDPDLVGERWRGMWLERLNATPSVLATWLSHQRYDSFWQHGSVALDYTRIKVPAYVVDGQIDAYRDFLPRLLKNLTVPRKGLLGPWGHQYPQLANPGPGLEWVHEEVRWWAQWLTGKDTGIMDEPMLRAYMESKTAGEVWPRDVPGRWVAEQTWPSPRVAPATWFLNTDGLGAVRGPDAIRTCTSQETLGLTKREWFPFNMNIELPKDQWADDQRSLMFDSPPLERAVEILGNAIVRVRVKSDQPIAKVAVRLNEVKAGQSWSVTYGILNLTHRDGHERPAPLEPGKVYDVEVPCYFTAHTFQPGSRIRVALSESLWPLAWPSPRPVTLEITAGASTLVLPVRPHEVGDQTIDVPQLRNRMRRRVSADPEYLEHAQVTLTGPDAAGKVTIHKQLRGAPETFADIGTTVTEASDRTVSISEGDPNSSVWRVESSTHMKRGAWDTTVVAAAELTSTAEEFHLKESIRALEGDKIVFERAWDNTIPRDYL